MPYLKAVDGAVELSLRVQPRASRTRCMGTLGAQLKLQLAAPPVDGAANAALLDFLAETLGVPRRQVTLVSGESSRSKRVRIEGIDAGLARARLTP